MRQWLNIAKGVVGLALAIGIFATNRELTPNWIILIFGFVGIATLGGSRGEAARKQPEKPVEVVARPPDDTESSTPRLPDSRIRGLVGLGPA